MTENTRPHEPKEVIRSQAEIDSAAAKVRATEQLMLSARESLTATMASACAGYHGAGRSYKWVINHVIEASKSLENARSAINLAGMELERLQEEAEKNGN